jgi:hypothetical protein
MSVDAIVWQAQAPLIDFARGVSSEVRVQRLALKALSLFSASLACIVVASSLAGVVVLSTSLLFLPLSALAYLSLQASLKVKDYSDPIELQSMKDEALTMGYLELLSEHESVEKILEHNILDILDLRAKFLLIHKGKNLSQILQDAPLTYVLKNKILTKEYIRGLFYDELVNQKEIKDLYSALEDMGINELKRFDVISVGEYEQLEELFAKSEKNDSLYRSNLLHLNSLFFGRRESVLEDLDRREKRAKEDLQKAHSQDKPTPFSVVRAFQNHLSAIQEEKMRVQKDETLGKALQKEYEKHKEESYQEYGLRKSDLQREFEDLKKSFPLKLV